MSKFNVEKINNYIQDVLENEKINMNWQVEFYADLMRIIDTEKKITVVTRDAYERYYGMKQAKLSTNWLNNYFDIANNFLQNNMKPSSFESLLTKVGPDDNSVQFSFVSKLFHTLKNDEPIYDRYVREFLGVGSPSGKKTENRQMAAVEIYEEKIVKGFYKNNDYAELRALMLKLFGEKFPNVKGVSEIKKLDFICWALGKKGYKIMEFIS